MKSFGLKELAEHYFATESEVTDYVAVSDYEKLKAERDDLYRNQIKIYETKDGSGEIFIAERGNFVPVEKYGVAMRENDKLKAERDALATQVAAYKERSSELYKLCDELIDHLRYNKAERDEVLNEFWDKQDAIKHVPRDPQQCLAEIKAEAGRAGFVDGLKVMHGKSYKLSEVLERAADQYAAKIRSTGTWLKDSNVNGGKR